MKLRINRRFLPKLTEDQIEDNQNLIDSVKSILLDSRGVPKEIPHWEWIQHFVDPFVNSYSPRYIRILQEGWTSHDVEQCHSFLHVILSNLPLAVQKDRAETMNLWNSFRESVKQANPSSPTETEIEISSNLL